MQTLIQLIIIASLFAVFYLFLVRPQAVRQKERQKLIAGLKEGQKVITIGGIIGTVKKLGDDTLVLSTAENVNLEMSRSSVASVFEAEKNNS